MTFRHECTKQARLLPRVNLQSIALLKRTPGFPLRMGVLPLSPLCRDSGTPCVTLSRFSYAYTTNHLFLQMFQHTFIFCIILYTLNLVSLQYLCIQIVIYAVSHVPNLIDDVFIFGWFSVKFNFLPIWTIRIYLYNFYTLLYTSNLVSDIFMFRRSLSSHQIVSVFIQFNLSRAFPTSTLISICSAEFFLLEISFTFIAFSLTFVTHFFISVSDDPFSRFTDSFEPSFLFLFDAMNTTSSVPRRFFNDLYARLFQKAFLALSLCPFLFFLSLSFQWKRLGFFADACRRRSTSSR